MSYIRYFMPMTSEAAGYGHKGRQPAGRSIVEGRDGRYKLTVWAQDLKPETLYNIFVLFAQGGRYAGIGMGGLTVDEKGKAEARRDFGDEVLMGCDWQEIAAVAVTVRGGVGVISPLCGYRGEVVPWRNGFYEHKREEAKPVEEVRSPVPEHKPRESAEPIEPSVENVEEPRPVTATEPTPIPINDESSGAHRAAALPQQESTPQQHSTNEAPSSPEEPHPTPPKSQPPPIDWAINLPKGEMAKAFRKALDKLHDDSLNNSAQSPSPHPPQILSIFQTNQAVTPFKRQTRKADWVRFTLSDPVPPPVNRPRLFEEPFIQAALAQHGHLILGMVTDPGPRRYIIGVPGSFDNESRQKARRLGFTQFKACEDAPPSHGVDGYWLMFMTA